MKSMKTFFISNSAHPCTEIALDSNSIRNLYLANGWSETDKPDSADDIIVSTCAYNQHYEDASADDLTEKDRLRKNGARIICTGCLSKINPERIRQFKDLETVAPLELEKMNSLVSADVKLEAVTSNYVNFHDYETNRLFVNVLKVKKALGSISDKLSLSLVPDWMATFPDQGWFFIRGSVGCLGNCAYCAVRKAKGRLKSVPVDKIIVQTRKAVEHGVREISLAGDDMGAYGHDIGSDLPELLSEMLKTGDNFKINIRFVEPKFLIRHIDKLLPIFSTGRISAFCVPIQSGSDELVRKMNRDYSISDLEKALQKIASIGKKAPRLASILMVGFPGETEEQFRQTARLIDRLPISFFQILIFEARPNTPAAQMSDQISDEVKKKRHDMLLRKFKLQKIVGLPAFLVDKIAGFQ
ncbi:MAG: radical SAM protein [Candidatus Riflebacteria bacterium]|nr:radical SAM protein [Candidatus Riflebacteria bacterium]